MSAPDSFTLEIVKGDLHFPPVVPKYVKTDIYRDISIFNGIDKHAIAESQINYKTFRDLIWNLCYKKKFSELERARAIFRWMTCRNLQTISFSETKPDSAESLLSLFKEGKTTYARIFECLVRHSGLACFTIRGWAKGVDYRPGVAITSKPVNHSWNAVYIDGNWQLVDCHWATRFLNADKNVPENLVYEYDDYYFIPEPDQLACTHFPEDPQWMLLDPVMTKAKFEDLPLLKSYFFSSGMYLLKGGEHGVIHSKKGVALVSCGLTDQMAYTFKFGFGNNMAETLDGVALAKYALQETTDEQVIYHVRLPKKGDYYLIIFANVSREQPSTADSIFKAVCEYKIVCDDPFKGDARFPPCSDICWGPDSYTALYGVTPKNRSGVLHLPDGHGELDFDKQPDVRVYARLIQDGKIPMDFKKNVAVKSEPDKATVTIDLPKEGEYGLEIYANDQVKDGDMFTHVCQYLCSYSNRPVAELYGSVPEATALKPRRTVSAESGALYKPGAAGIEENAPSEGNTSNNFSYPFGETIVETESVIVPLGPVEPEKEYNPHSSEMYKVEVELKAPDTFELTETKDQGDAPKPEAGTITSQKLFIDTTVFKDVDTHAATISKMEQGSFKEILWQLIYSRGITNDLDRARAIFLWLCSKDLSKLNFENCEKGSPENELMNLQKGQNTYARVYETLCSYAGLHCKTLSGFAKGAEYKPGMKFTGQQGQHSWNVVLINGTWQLVDCHWAARRLVGKKLANENVRYELDEYYFMPAPSQLIFSHFPENTNWQLLEKPITQDEFENLVPVKPTFFKYGLQLVNYVNAVIDCKDKVTIRINCNQKKCNLRFTFNLTYEDGREDFGSIKLNRFAMQEVVENACFITFRPPESASYLLVVYAKDLDQQTKEGVYGGVCEYKIVSTTSSEPNPFPPCVHTFWGPGDSASKFEMTPLQKGSIVQTVDGIAEIKFKLTKKLKFMAKLKKNDMDEKQLSCNVFYRVVNNVAIFYVNPPCPGEMGLELYANDPETGSQTLQHAYQYLIIVKEVDTQCEAFPALPTGYLGPQVTFDQIGMKTISHEDPFIQTDAGDIQVTFGASQPLRTSSQLIYVSQNKTIDCSEYVLQQGSETGITYLLKLTEPGLYKFQLFALPQSEPGDSLVGVYNYLIRCKNSISNLVPFPKQYGPWKDGGYLHEPLDGHLQPGQSSSSASSPQHVYFKMEVPKAETVAIVIGTEWTTLQQKQPGCWEGEISLEKHLGTDKKVSVCANFGGGASASFSTLLEYSM